MVEATVKTVQFIDPRIEPQPDPLYDYVIGPLQNQFYKIPASGRSNSSLTFNNLTTLGIDRAYLDTFELEIGATITFNLDTNAYYDSGNTTSGTHARAKKSINSSVIVPAPDEWTFQSFPFNTCCEEARININGGAFFSQPMAYVRAKERYMDQWALSKCYENICPIHKPLCQKESERPGNQEMSIIESSLWNSPQSLLGMYIPGGEEIDTLANSTTGSIIQDESTKIVSAVLTSGHLPRANIKQDFLAASPLNGIGVPTRLGSGMFNCMQSDQGMSGGYNNSIVRTGKYNNTTYKYEKIYRDGNKLIVKVTWREPIFCSPFSSRYDATYGRPLYNITSMDLSFNLNNLGNMIRVANLHHNSGYTYSVNTSATDVSDADKIANFADIFVSSYSINIDTANLCYQVMTIPPSIQKPLTTLVPYRRFVPYITEYNTQSGQQAENGITPNDFTTIDIKSGVYTFNEIPTAIWIFCAPTKNLVQENPSSQRLTDALKVAAGSPEQPPTDSEPATADLVRAVSTTLSGNWESNKLFGYLEHVDISLANTTQILNTAQREDLYRIAKANGCEDSYLSWGGYDILMPKTCFDPNMGYQPRQMYHGAGSVLRLKPGVDIIIPDRPLIPAANANNMVFQVNAQFTIPPHPPMINNYALWLLFEYVGVAAISPGQCQITMNPLGTGDIMMQSPVMSATSAESEGKLEGSGFWDVVKKIKQILMGAWRNGTARDIYDALPKNTQEGLKRALDSVPPPAAAPAKKVKGGAVMGRGLNDWV